MRELGKDVEVDITQEELSRTLARVRLIPEATVGDLKKALKNLLQGRIDGFDDFDVKLFKPDGEEASDDFPLSQTRMQ